MGHKIIRRSEWGARPPRSRARADWTRHRTLWVHHTVTPAPAPTISAETSAVRAIQAGHLAQGWSDIGYAYLIAPSGRIYEGRGNGVWAAHCPGKNGEPSVALLGTYMSVPPTDAQKRAVWWLADHLGLTHLRGHREAYATSCPGDACMRTLVRAPRPPKITPTPTKRPYGGSLRLSVQSPAEQAAGRPGRAWAGWSEAEGAIRWVARHGLHPRSKCAIAWRGNVWRGPKAVRNVCRNLTQRYLNK